MTRLSILMATSAVASLAAGVIHAVAIGIHADDRQASLVFVAIALFQVGWAVAVLSSSVAARRWLAVVGALGSAGVVAGWFLATQSGISWIDGLETPVGASLSDMIAAGLAAATAVCAAAFVVAERVPAVRSLRAPATSLSSGIVVAVIALVALPGLVAASDHSDHDHGATEVGDDDHDDHDHEAAPSSEDVALAVDSDGSHDDDGHHDNDGSHDDADGHHDDASEDDAHGAVGDSSAAVTTRAVEVCAEDGAGSSTHLHDDGSSHVHDDEPVPVCEMVETSAYHPDLPIDLAGMPGVTPEQQARAENLVAVTLALLPRYADVDDAIADGYYSFGDGVTGHEHFLNWDLVDDGRILDPAYPESLVYATRDGERTLVSAMFMLDRDDTLDTVPDVGGALMQWHIHQDICMTTGEQPTLAGIRSIGGSCGSGVGFPDIPMIHVWIEPNECGPFAALEGIGAGQVAEGEEKLCDHAHGH